MADEIHVSTQESSNLKCAAIVTLNPSSDGVRENKINILQDLILAPILPLALVLRSAMRVFLNKSGFAQLAKMAINAALQLKALPPIYLALVLGSLRRCNGASGSGSKPLISCFVVLSHAFR